MPTPSNAAAGFPLEQSLRQQGEISLQMSHFLLGYLRLLYKHFDGDLALVIVLGEIAHHNMAPHFSVEAGVDPEVKRRFDHDEALRGRMQSCNAYSLAAATGMPRETVRRKIARLEHLGWVERASRREVRITPAVAQHFGPDFNLNLLVQLLNTADRIRDLLDS